MQPTPSPVLLVGPFPPPRHGVSAVNEAVAEALLRSGRPAERVNTAPPSLDRRLRYRLQRFGRIFRALRAVLRAPRRRMSRCYFSLSGGFGLLYEGLLIFVATRRGARVAVHHHSFRYLDQSYWPMHLVVWAGGREALHVVLGPAMQRSLHRRYPQLGDSLTMSNAALIGAPIAVEGDARAAPRTIGLLANLSAAKGLVDFLDLAEACRDRRLPWRFLLAGPFESAAEADRLRPRIAALPNLEYRGPLYADAKDAFFRETDVFVFPTRYVHEAEPLVVLEAMRQGCPVIAYGRGCIPDMIGLEGGMTIPVGEEFLPRALGQLEAWRAADGNFPARRLAARRRFAEMHGQSAVAMERFIEKFYD